MLVSHRSGGPHWACSGTYFSVYREEQTAVSDCTEVVSMKMFPAQSVDTFKTKTTRATIKINRAPETLRHHNFIAAVQLTRLCVLMTLSLLLHGDAVVFLISCYSDGAKKPSVCTEIRDDAFTDTTDTLDFRIFGGFSGRYDTDASSADRRSCFVIIFRLEKFTWIPSRVGNSGKILVRDADRSKHLGCWLETSAKVMFYGVIVSFPYLKYWKQLLACCCFFKRSER